MEPLRSFLSACTTYKYILTNGKDTSIALTETKGHEEQDSRPDSLGYSNETVSAREVIGIADHARLTSTDAFAIGITIRAVLFQTPNHAAQDLRYGHIHAST
jgi:hypothetical protein